MKTTSFIRFLLPTLLLSIQLTTAQVVVRNEPAFVYYLPQTVCEFEVEVERTEVLVGPFFRYSERYLGTADVAKESQVTYAIKSVRMSTKAEADPARCYKITPDKNIFSYMPQIDERGLLCAVNEIVPSVAIPAKVVGNNPEPALSKAPLMPLNEEQMLASSVAKMAEGAAKQIYLLRTSRTNWLIGDVEKMPADGESFDKLLCELNKQEQELTELFVGKTVKKTYTTTIRYIPTASQNSEVLFRFSKTAGVVDANDLSGTPVYLNMQAQRQQYIETSKPMSAGSVALYANLPGSAEIRVVEGKFEWVNERIEVAQFGVSVPLKMELFGKQPAKVRFNPETGAVLSISK